MKPALGALLAVVMLTPAAVGGDVGFVEDFALAKDRTAVLAQLIPGTDEYYYYHALHYLNTEQYDKATALLDPWAKRHGTTQRANEIALRHAMLTYDRDPRKSLEYLRNKLGLQLNHQRTAVGVVPNLPSELNQAGITRPVLLADSIRRWGTLDNFEDAALDWLAAEKLDPSRRRMLLQRLQRPDVPELPKLVADDLAMSDNPGFGAYPVHRLMTAAQLDELEKLRPKVREEMAFVLTRLAKLQPGADDDWRRNPALTKAYLDRVLAYARTLGQTHNTLKAHALYHRLAFDRAHGTPDKALFLEYLKLPRPQPYISVRMRDSVELARYPADPTANFDGLTLLPPVGTDEPLVRAYLKQFLADADSPKEFEPFVRDVYLRHLFAEVKIELGLGEPERWASDLPPELYQQIKDRIDIDFAPTNKTQFAADEPVSLDLFVKNVPTLFVKVFEINSVNFYRERRREIDTDVNLDGLVPNAEQTHAYPEPPARRVARRFAFPQLTKPGVYVIDFIGAGKSSRALVRKGRLRPLVETGSDGQRVRVVDEANKLVPDAAVWFGGKEYAADKDGKVVLPFGAGGRQPVVLRRGDFASLDHIDHQGEGYRLAAGLFVDREQLLSERTATLVVRPGLYLNNSPISVSLLDEPKITLTATDHDGVRTTSEIPNVKLFEDRETTHQFRVPPRLASLSVALTAKVKALGTGQPVDVAAAESFVVNAIARTDKIDDLHLTRFGADYYLELLGRTGEPKPDRAVQLAFKHRDFREPVRFTLKTDVRGRIFLGPLPDITSVTAANPDGTSHTWPLAPDRATIRPIVHAKAGEPVFIPYAGVKAGREEIALFEMVGPDTQHLVTYVVNADGKAMTVTAAGGTIRTDRFDAVKLDDGQLALSGLAAGDYDLWLKRTNDRIRVRVVDGPVAGGYVLGSRRDMELPKLKPVRIAAITADANTVAVKLADASAFARVHVIATRYEPAVGAFDALSRVRANALAGSYPASADSAYLTGRNIGDEYRYVLDRKNQKKFPGNMLDRPQVLLNPWAVRATEAGVQEAQAGGAFGGVGAAKEAGKAEGFGADPGRAGVAAGVYSELDFLADPAVVIANLVPDKDGVVTVDRPRLGNKSMVRVVAVDPLHTVSKSFGLPETPAAHLDLRLRAGFDPKRHFTQQKKVSVLPASQPFTLADAAGSRFETYDSLAKVYALYATLLPNDTKLAEFAFAVRWPTLKAEEKRAEYSKSSSHELNFFLFHKDKPFFAEVVKPYLANKRDKTFLDRWLLEEDLTEFVKPWRYGRLNAVERVLLGRRLPGEGPKTARHLNELLKLLPPNAERDRMLFETGVKASALENDVPRLLPADAPGPNDAPMAALPAPKPAAGGMPGMGGAPGGPGGFGGGGFGGMPGPSGRPGGGELRGSSGMAGGRGGGMPPPAKAAEKMRQRDGDAKDLAERKEQLQNQSEDVRDKLFKNLGTTPGEPFFEADRRKSTAAPLYRKIEPTQEWAENNYYKLLVAQQTAELVTVNPFWTDYAGHAGDGPFLSSHVAAAARNFTEAMLALSVLDLPFASPKLEVKFEAGKMTYTPVSAAIAFHEEVKPVGDPQPKVPVLVSQNVYKHGDRYRDENGERLDKFVSGEFVVHTVYGCQVVVTNPGPSPQRLSVLLQVPVGSIALNTMPPTKTQLLDLQPYQTAALDYLFYFPKPGTFPHFPAHVAKNEQLLVAATPLTFNVVPVPTKLDTESWEYVSQNGTDDQVVAFLNRENVHALNLDRVAFRMKDAKFFETVTQLLAARHAYAPTLWAYALLHDNAAAAREFLLHQDGLANEAGGPLDSPLVTFNPIERFTFEHLEYKPLVNARAHSLGKRRQIVNDRFHAQYHAFLKQLSYRRTLTDDDHLAAVYYLLLQDRIDEATTRFAQIDAGKLATKLQYDYCAAYLAMFEDDPQRAKAIADRHANHPVDKWRNLFAAVANTLDEAAGKAPKAADPLDRDQRQAALAAAEPGFDFTLDNKAVNLSWQNLNAVTVNYYLMDVELLFSTNPFVQQAGGQFRYIKPNATKAVALPAGQTKLSVPLPAELVKRNVLIEVTAAGKTRSLPYYATAMDLKLTDGYGQLKVTAADGGKPLAKVYVKAYVRTADGQVKFHKDGYTDHRGRFDYATVSTPERVAPVRYAVLVFSEEYGALIREVAPPQQ